MDIEWPSNKNQPQGLFMNLYQYILVALAMMLMMSIFDNKPAANTELHAGISSYDLLSSTSLIRH